MGTEQHEHHSEAVPSRRSLLKAAAGAVVIGVGGAIPLGSATRAAADVVNAGLFLGHGERTMIDSLVVPFLGFGSTPDRLETPRWELGGENRGTGDPAI